MALHLIKSAEQVKQLIEVCEQQLNENDRKSLIKLVNSDGQAPLHAAIKHNHPDVARQLIEAGADIETKTRDEYGSNPLHVAAEVNSAETVRAVHVEKEEGKFLNALNASNKKGLTPLMLSACENHMNSAVAFLQAGANPDLQNPTTGDCALHYAATMGYSAIVRALLCFDAKLGVKNHNGVMPLEASQISKTDGTKECIEVLEDMVQLENEVTDKVCKEFIPVDVPSTSIFLLSMHGRGTRGLLLTQLLIVIQKHMKKLKPDCLSLHEYLDYVVGTSAGGLATLSMVCAKASIEKTRGILSKSCRRSVRVYSNFSRGSCGKILKAGIRWEQQNYGHQTPAHYNYNGRS